jgi:hypothetical protein
MAHRGVQIINIQGLEQILQLGHHWYFWESLHYKVYSMGHTMLRHSCNKNVFPSLKCQSNIASLKRKTPFPPKQMSFSPHSFLVNLLCYIRDCVMERVRLFTLPPWSVKRISTLNFHACITYTWTKIYN